MEQWAHGLAQPMAISSGSCYAFCMEIKVHLPDDLGARPDVAREALESLAIEGYRTGVLSHFQASQLLGMSRFEFEGFLKERKIHDHAYGVEELEHDVETLRKLGV